MSAPRLQTLRRRRVALLGVWLALVGAMAVASDAQAPPLRAARWLPPERMQRALTERPPACQVAAETPEIAERIAIGRAAFRTPLLLGGQAARAGLACDSCHRNGRNNPDFAFPGISGEPGTADVTSALFSSHRGDGVFNPRPIPDLAGSPAQLKVPRDRESGALERFIHGLIVEEFDGPEPSAATLDGLAEYVRHQRPTACTESAPEPLRAARYFDDARAALAAARIADAHHDAATARLMVASARTALGLIAERFQGTSGHAARAALADASQRLADIQQAIDAHDGDVGPRIDRWLTDLAPLSTRIAHDEAHSQFEPAVLATWLKSLPAATTAPHAR